MSSLFRALRFQFFNISRSVVERYRGGSGRVLVAALDENPFPFVPYIKGLYASDFQILANNTKDFGSNLQRALYMASLKSFKPRREATDKVQTDSANYRVGILNCQK